MTKDRRDAVIVAALAASLYFPTAVLCGLYLDDYSFLRTLEGISAAGLWQAFLHYVPGRNLHILFFYALIRLTGGSVPAMHAVSTAFDAANAALVFVFVRRFTGLRSISWAAAAIFLVAPNHGETHYWINAIPQNQASTFLVLCAFVLASRPKSPALGAAIALYAAALFTYEQAFFLWPLLLAVAWRAEERPRPVRFAAASAALLALNLLHLAARYLSPFSDGGRPLIRFGDVLRRSYDAAVSVRSGLLPWPTSSHAHWLWSVPAAAAALGAGAWLTRRIRAEAGSEGSELALFNGRGWMPAAAFGLAWTVLAYGPNLFWYLSPRHSLLPSVGWSVLAAALGAAAAARSARFSSALPWAAALLFAVAALSDLHEGTQWIDSRRLRDGFIAEARRLDQPVDSLFLIGAPRSLRRAPAFSLFHDVTFAAGRALGRPSLATGDRLAAPTRHGLVYSNDLADVAPDAFRWLPAEKANLISYDPASRSFACAAALSLVLPDESREILPLRPNRNCTSVPDVSVETALVHSGPIADPSAGAGAPRAAGLALARAELSVIAGVTHLELDWSVEAPPARTLAFVPRVKDAAGTFLLDSVFPSRGPRNADPILWPLIDDEAPRDELLRGQGLRQVFELRRPVAGSAAAAVLELDVFELRDDGSARPAGRLSVPVAVRRM